MWLKRGRSSEIDQACGFPLLTIETAVFNKAFHKLYFQSTSPAMSYEAQDGPTNISLMQPERPRDLMSEPIAGSKRPDSPVDAKPGPPKPAKTQSPGTHRPPKPPGDLMGPYIHFVTTTPDKQWRGSVLMLHRKGTEAPVLEFPTYQVSQSSTMLYEDVFGLTAIRVDITLPIPDGMGDERIDWTLTYSHNKTRKSNSFHIPRWDQKIRGGFNSCNGFDESVPQETVDLLGFDNVWRHLNSVHKETPLHLLLWGGDQIYIDFIFHDIPFLVRWIGLEWDQKWKHEFSEETSHQVAEYYFNTYHETWERPEVKQALETIPNLMMWDDHDIFDGAGSYPPELHDSPVMLGLFRSAKKFRLLFQHHTTIEMSESHGFFGVQSQNYVGQYGPRVAILIPDGRSERNHIQVHEQASEDMWFQKLEERVAPTTQHLLTVFAVPFSFIRVRVAEKLFGFLKSQNPWVRKLPGVKGLNSIFDLPEFYDDLLDEWCHDSHINERDRILKKLQDFAKNRSIRVTLVSGDVHCAAFSMFRSDSATRHKLKLKPENDHRLMYQVISSAIVNQAPSANACIGYHYIANAWHPIADTDEGLVEMFERRPEQGKHVRHRRVMPNRNWTFFEEVGDSPGSYGGMDESTRNVYQTRQSQDGANGHANGHHDKEHNHPRLHRKSKNGKDLSWHREHYAFDRKKGYPSTLGPVSNPDGTGILEEPVHQHHHGLFCHHRNSKLLHRSAKGDGDGADEGNNDNQMQNGEIVQHGNSSTEAVSGLRIRMWLESRRKEAKGRQFASYECVVPNLVALPAA